LGTAGVVTTDIGNYYSTANSIALQTDGKIVVAGISVYGNGSKRSFTIARYNCGPLGIDEINTNKYIHIFPNPNNGNMQIAYEIPENTIGTFSIYDLMGSQILSYPLNGGKNTLTISGTEINAGIYFYRATAGNKVIAKNKIVVIK